MGKQMLRTHEGGTETWFCVEGLATIFISLIVRSAIFDIPLDDPLVIGGPGRLAIGAYFKLAFSLIRGILDTIYSGKSPRTASMPDSLSTNATTGPSSLAAKRESSMNAMPRQKLTTSDVTKGRITSTWRAVELS